MWERYCRGVQAIVYMVDAADLDSLDAAKEELHSLLARPSLVCLSACLGAYTCACMCFGT